MRMFRSLSAQAQLRLQLFLKDRMTLLVLAVSVFCFFFCMEDMNREAENLATIPIGLVDLDKSEKSKELAGRLEGLEALSVKYGTYGELSALMEEGEIRCIFEIRERYGEKVDAGKSRKLVNVYYEQDDKVAAIVADIVAGEMMYDICQAQAYLAYEELPAGEKEKFSRQEYEAYAASLIGDGDFDFAFEFRFVDGKQQERREGLKSSLFYRQAVAAVAAMLFALLQMAALSGVCTEKEQGICQRRHLVGLTRPVELLGNMLACTVLCAVPAAVFAVCVAAGVGNWEKFLPVFWTSVLFSVMMALIYYLLANWLPGLLAYQVVGTVVLVVLAICGFCSMVEGILFREFPVWFRFLPNNVYLRWFVQILAP
ncbi:MAG: ABC transporter permease [Lachnospiraceae bacterium]|nr:ABC transporter permease [Lachnospiraceae bacterium]